jgi:hypothetical protein
MYEPDNWVVIKVKGRQTDALGENNDETSI